MDRCLCVAKRSSLCPIHATEEEKNPLRVYVRYVGTKHALITNRAGAFVVVEREELRGEELELCKQGGGHFVMSETVFAGLQWK